MVFKVQMRRRKGIILGFECFFAIYVSSPFENCGIKLQAILPSFGDIRECCFKNVRVHSLKFENFPSMRCSFPFHV